MDVIDVKTYIDELGRRRNDLQGAIKEGFENVRFTYGHYQNATHYAVMMFVKMIPPLDRWRLNEKTNQMEYVERKLCTVARITLPTPEWGSTVHIVDNLTGKHGTLWSLPSLDPQTGKPLYSLESHMGNPNSFVRLSIERKLDGSLERAVWDYNLQPSVIRQVEALHRRKLLPFRDMACDALSLQKHRVR